jgi:O-acetylserine/cysteine efflux transporter
LVPVVGLLAAYVAFGEQPAGLQWLGTAVVLLGLGVNQLGARLSTRLSRSAR